MPPEDPHKFLSVRPAAFYCRRAVRKAYNNRQKVEDTAVHSLRFPGNTLNISSFPSFSTEVGDFSTLSQ